MIQLFDYALRENSGTDMVGIFIRNEKHQMDKSVGISFGRKNQISSDVTWSVLEDISQSNARFNAADTGLEVHAVKMPLGFDRKDALKTVGRQLANLVHLKRSIVEVKAKKIALLKHYLSWLRKYKVVQI